MESELRVSEVSGVSGESGVRGVSGVGDVSGMRKESESIVNELQMKI